MILSHTERHDSRETKISVPLLDLNVIKITTTATCQEYLTEPLDRKPARQAEITLAGKY